MLQLDGKLPLKLLRRRDLPNASGFCTHIHKRALAPINTNSQVAHTSPIRARVIMRIQPCPAAVAVVTASACPPVVGAPVRIADAQVPQRIAL